MASFKADKEKLEKLFLDNADILFAFSFISCQKLDDSIEIMQDILCETAANQKDFDLANGENGEIFILVQRACNAYFAKKLRKSPKAEALAKINAPFKVTPELVNILRLPEKYKAPLFLTLYMDLSVETAAKLMKKSPAYIEKINDSALKKLGDDVTAEEVKVLLKSIIIKKDAAERVFDKTIPVIEKADFSRNQGAKRFKRRMDFAIPYIALALVIVAALSFFSVQYGWFGVKYERSTPIEGYNPSIPDDDIIYKTDLMSRPNTENEVAILVENISVYVPKDDGFIKYVVRNTPIAPNNIVSQMIALGTLPEDTELVSFTLGDNGVESENGETVVYTAGDEYTLEIVFSENLKAYIEASNGEKTLQALVKTFTEIYTNIDFISFKAGGEELTCNNMTAQDFLGKDIKISEAIEVDFKN